MDSLSETEPIRQNENKRQVKDLTREFQREILRIGIVIIDVSVNVTLQS